MFGVYLNENWSLDVGGCLRYLSGFGKTSLPFAPVVDLRAVGPADGAYTDFRVKQNAIHAAEVGVMYRF